MRLAARCSRSRGSPSTSAAAPPGPRHEGMDHRRPAGRRDRARGYGGGGARAGGGGGALRLGLVMSWYAVGAAGVETAGDPLPEETRAAASGADAVLLGAVGDPAFDHAPRHLKPETGLLALRALLGVYANLRPVAIHPALVGRSPVKPDRLRDVDLLIVRELTGGLYYGEPRGKNALQAVNTLAYSVSEIERVARVAFQAARRRRRLVASVDKANVLEVSQLWRETVTRIGRDEYPDVRLEHLYVDYAAMRLVAEPAAFDVLLTENTFGDILSDEAARSEEHT